MPRLWFLLLFCTVVCFGQRHAEIGIVSDNDSYTSPINDQYYTNGIEFFYRYLNNPKETHALKSLTEFRVGQYIYSPQSVRAADINVHDRPYAGYLFAEMRLSKFYTRNRVLKLKFQGGVVGPEALGRQFQEGLHKLLHLPTVAGWEYQITTTPAIQADVFYAKGIYEAPSRRWDMFLQGEVNAGTIWDCATLGPMARISLRGALQDIHHSMHFGAALEEDKAEYAQHGELFLYINPNIQYMGYDATILGSMFNDTSPVTWPLIHWRFNGEAGLKYRKNHWTYAFVFNYRGKEAINRVITGFYYGSLQLSYLLAP